MRHVFSVSVMVAAVAIFATPAGAQSQADGWMFNAQIGPSFGTFGTIPNFDAAAGYRLNDQWSVVGEFGGLSHAPFKKAAPMILFTGAIAHAQAYAPIVTMTVTRPDGRMEELTAPESGLATLTLSDGTEYGFRPTIQDSMPWNRIVVTIFRMGTATTATESLGELELKRGGPATTAKTKPSFTIAVPAVAASPTSTPTQ